MYLLDFSSCQGYGMAAPAALTPEVIRHKLPCLPRSCMHVCEHGLRV